MNRKSESLKVEGQRPRTDCDSGPQIDRLSIYDLGMWRFEIWAPHVAQTAKQTLQFAETKICSAFYAFVALSIPELVQGRIYGKPRVCCRLSLQPTQCSTTQLHGDSEWTPGAVQEVSSSPKGKLKIMGPFESGAHEIGHQGTAAKACIKCSHWNHLEIFLIYGEWQLLAKKIDPSWIANDDFLAQS